MLPASSKLRSSTESEKTKLLMLREKNLTEKESELSKRELALKNFESELLAREKVLNAKLEERRAELIERERLLNEILRMYEMPLVNGDLQKYLDQCASSTALGSGTLCSTGLKESKLSFSPQTNPDHKRVPRLPHTQQSSQTTSQV